MLKKRMHQERGGEQLEEVQRLNIFVSGEWRHHGAHEQEVAIVVWRVAAASFHSPGSKIKMVQVLL